MDFDVNSLATITTSDGVVSYRLTPDDVLWMARCTCRESSAEPELVTWAMTQRYVLRHAKTDFIATLRSFSQPINPIWAADGSMCRVGGAYHGKPECSADKLATRKWYTNATWVQLTERHESTVNVVALWAFGKVVNRVPRVTNFAHASVAKRYLANFPDSQLFYKGDNWYIVDPTASTWPNNYVQMVDVSGSVAVADSSPTSFVAAIFKGATSWWKA